MKKQSLHPVVQEYCAFMRSWDASPTTVYARAVFANARMRDFGSPDGFTPDAIREWFASSELERWSRTTYHAHLKSFCEFLKTAGYLEINPMEEVRKPRTPRSEPRPLSSAEVVTVLEHAEGRDRDFLLIALLSGLRAHEIAKIRGQDITPNGIYVKGKGGVEATISTHPDLWAMAQRYPRSGYWFPGNKGKPHIQGATVSRAVGRLFYGLGIEGSIHRCRHVYGTTLLRQGVHIRRVQKLMRHGSLQTTALYTAVDEDELREAINRLPSIA